jgi:mycobactin peptide synthetase MbtE
MGILYNDLIAAYRARAAGTAPQWPERPVEYADYVLWQRHTFDADGDWARAQFAHWRKALEGLPDEIAVAPDRTRPVILGRRGVTAKFTVSPERRAALVRLAEQERATEFMLYEAVLATVMHILGAGVDVAIGSPAASRTDPASADVVGLFANMVVLRNDFSGSPTLRDIVGRTRDTVLDAFAHSELPIERLVEAINPPRSRSRNPLFQTMINVIGQDWAVAPQAVSADTTVVGLPMDLDVPYLDLNVGLTVTADAGLDVWVVANADLYDLETVQQIGHALDKAFDAFATVPDRGVSELELLPPATMERLLAAPTPAAAEPGGTGVRGSAETERILIALLEELLDITGVEPGDNFFALGGDSIVSVQWSARAATQGVAFTPAMVFEHMTIGGLAAAADAQANPPAAAQISSQEYAPMSASGLTPDALAGLTASWQQRT